ncbi:MAG: DUF1566 domain-containing protein, partial [Candidatus Electrothrix sp. AUS1_2]|nr:DUF1566 domain-containing protein [Candidatus Electrothrix sp. AUS1_2]
MIDFYGQGDNIVSLIICIYNTPQTSYGETIMRLFNRIGLSFAFLLVATGSYVWAANFNPLPDTGQSACYDADGNVISCPEAGEPFYGQDAQYQGVAPSYTDNGDGTVTDNNTGFMWQKATADVDNDGVITSGYYGDGMSWQKAVDYCDELTFADLSDWRLPTRFELFSLIDFGRVSPAIDPIFQCEPQIRLQHP